MKTYQLLITLKNTKPKIWRRILVPDDLLLEDFHFVIQATMGWTNSHLHQFSKDKKYYAPAYEDDWEPANPRMVEYSDYKVSDLLVKPKDELMYEYDFGDGWMHEILLEKIISDEEAASDPVCIDGQMSCPPEDCGGIGGYYRLLSIIANSKDPEYEDTMEWLGEDFDPEFFDLNKVNEVLESGELDQLDDFDEEDDDFDEEADDLDDETTDFYNPSSN